jgi:hypothetical protein
MTDTITTAPEFSAVPVTERDETDALLDALEIGDTVTVTKDHHTHLLTVVNILDGPYVIARGERDFTVGFDRASIVHGIVQVSR